MKSTQKRAYERPTLTERGRLDKITAVSPVYPPIPT